MKIPARALGLLILASWVTNAASVTLDHRHSCAPYFTTSTSRITSLDDLAREARRISDDLTLGWGDESEPKLELFAELQPPTEALLEYERSQIKTYDDLAAWLKVVIRLAFVSTLKERAYASVESLDLNSIFDRINPDATQMQELVTSFHSIDSSSYPKFQFVNAYRLFLELRQRRNAAEYFELILGREQGSPAHHFTHPDGFINGSVRGFLNSLPAHERETLRNSLVNKMRHLRTQVAQLNENAKPGADFSKNFLAAEKTLDIKRNTEFHVAVLMHPEALKLS